MNNDANAVRLAFDAVVRDYLLNISSLANHDYFSPKSEPDSRERYYHCKGFPILMNNKDNEYVVAEENYLEGCTRVFLLNPMLKRLLDRYGIDNDWRFGDTFSDKFYLPNREYENDAYLEFIFVHQGKRIGCRYTRNSYSLSESVVMERDSAYRLNHTPIPGFDKLSPVDEVWSIDWSGIPDEDLASIHQLPVGMKSFSRDVSIATFFKEIFSENELEIFSSTAKSAISEAQRIIALKAVPQLLPNNMLTFKEATMTAFSDVGVAALSYQFKNCSSPVPVALSVSDIQKINDVFFKEERRYAIIGHSEFAKSFITSEYLFRSISSGLGIDYTAVVVGYLKSVEQLMYLLYVSAFDGSQRMKYWDVCRWSKRNQFDTKLPQFRIDPYDPNQQRKQEEFYHDIKTGTNALEFGGLALFLRYFEKMWNVSENGKEFIFACLDDYRSSCRNSHFHKDNISFMEYETVKRIRNNTHVLLYYLLGGFKLLDSGVAINTQLGIEDYSFDRLYQTIWRRRRRVFWVKIHRGYEGIVYYLNQDPIGSYDEAGLLKQAQLSFVSFPGIAREDAVIKELHELRDNPGYVKEHTVVITRDTELDLIEPFMPKRKR